MAASKPTPFVDVRRGLPGTPQSSLSQGRYRPLPLPPPAPSPVFPEADPYYEFGSPSAPAIATRLPNPYPFVTSPDLLKQPVTENGHNRTNFPPPTSPTDNFSDGEMEDLPPYGGEGPSAYAPPPTDPKSEIIKAEMVPTGHPVGSSMTGNAIAGPSILPPPPPPPPPPLPVAGPSTDPRIATDIFTTMNDIPTLNGYYQPPDNSVYRGPGIQLSIPLPSQTTRDYPPSEQSHLSIALEDNSLGQYSS